MPTKLTRRIDEITVRGGRGLGYWLGGTLVMIAYPVDSAWRVADYDAELKVSMPIEDVADYPAAFERLIAAASFQ